MPTLNDLNEVKVALEIDPANTAEDKKLLLFLDYASDWIGELLNRRNGILYKSRTEYYDGTGTTRLLLRSRPVFTSPTIQVVHDANGFYGCTSGSYSPSTATTLTFGVDFALKVDQDDGSSRSGILVKMNGVWEKKFGRQAGWLSPFVVRDTGSYQVVYSAGWTVDAMPALLREAVMTLVARMRYLFPVGMEIGSESYEERNITVVSEKKDYLMGLVKPMILPYFRNWSF
jgi:hypothetical protein